VLPRQPHMDKLSLKSASNRALLCEYTWQVSAQKQLKQSRKEVSTALPVKYKFLRKQGFQMG